MPPPSGPPPSGPPPQAPPPSDAPGSPSVEHFDSEMANIKDSLRTLQETTGGMGNKFGVPGISEDEAAAVSSTDHGMGDNYSTGLDPRSIRITKGWLWKKASDSNKWKKRWFLLKHELRSKTDSYELFYYAKEQDSTPKAIIVLNGAEVTAEAAHSNEKDVKFEFQLHVAGGMVVHLHAETAALRADWVDTLGAIIHAHRSSMHLGSSFGSLAAGGARGGLYNIEVTPDHAQSCEAFGPGLFGAESGVATTFTIQATDAQGQPATDGGLPFTATLENDTHLYNIQVMDNEDGTYSSTYAISAPGEYSLSLKLNDEYPILGSPFFAKVEPGPAAAHKCSCKGDGLVQAKSMETSYFSIEAKDAMGNRREAGGEEFEVAVSGPALLKGLQDNSDGTYVG